MIRRARPKYLENNYIDKIYKQKKMKISTLIEVLQHLDFY